MKCDYCGNEIEDKKVKNCSKCGGPIIAPKTEKAEPFFFHGFMIWPERDFVADQETYHIWLGDRHVGQFSISREARQAYIDVRGEGASGDELIYKLLRLTIGDSDVEKYEAMNYGRKFAYEIRRIECQEFIEARELISELMGA